MKKVIIKCDGTDYLSLDEITPLQGSLKQLDDDNKEKIKKSLIDNGFLFPFFVWRDSDKKYYIDGHQRDIVLRELAAEGVDIPEKFPVVYVDARDKKEAALAILISSSYYADVTYTGLSEYIDTFDLDLNDADINIPNIDINSILNMVDDKEVGWNPEKNFDTEKGDGINDLVGYGLQSFWKDIKNENTETFKYQIELPIQEKTNLVRQKYSRTNLEEIERVVKTYMREGDYFLETCCG